MLQDKDRIFRNLYNDYKSDLSGANKIGDWVNTKEIISKGRDLMVFSSSEFCSQENKLKKIKKPSAI